MQLIALREGGVKCSSACPFYTERGVVKGCYDVPLATHCRATMQPVIVDCEVYNVHRIDKMEVTEEQWEQMQKAIGRKASKQRKLCPEENNMGRPVGSTWTEDRWNAQKSARAKKITNYRQRKDLKNGNVGCQPTQ